MKGKFFSLLLSIVVAFGFWVYVVAVVSPDSDATFYNIPVVLNNEAIMTDKGMMIESGKETTVTLQLKGNRTDLNSLKNSDITVVADLSKINSAGIQELAYSVSFGGMQFEILNQYPSKLTLEIAEWDTKEVPVNLVYLGTLDADRIAYKDEVTKSADHVTITGPKEVVDQIAQAVISINLDGQTQNINREYVYTLCNADGEPIDAASVTTNVGQIAVSLRIQRVKEVQLLVNVTYGGGATAENTQILLSEQVIKITGTDKLLESQGDTLVVGDVHLGEIPENTVLTFPISLLDGVENLSGISEVEVDISFPNLATKTLEITKIFVTGLDPSMEYEISTKKVNVTVRGPVGLISHIEPEDVFLLVDLTDAQLGEDLYKAQAWFDKEFEGFGAIGSYSVLVTLRETGLGES